MNENNYIYKDFKIENNIYKKNYKYYVLPNNKRIEEYEIGRMQDVEAAIFIVQKDYKYFKKLILLLLLVLIDVVDRINKRNILNLILFFHYITSLLEYLIMNIYNQKIYKE